MAGFYGILIWMFFLLDLDEYLSYILLKRFIASESNGRNAGKKFKRLNAVERGCQ
jgi:hypothetical protein